jgi:hypothetical protein
VVEFTICDAEVNTSSQNDGSNTHTHTRARARALLSFFISLFLNYFDVKHLAPPTPIQELVCPFLSGRTSVSFSSRLIINVKLNVTFSRVVHTILIKATSVWLCFPYTNICTPLTVRIPKSIKNLTAFQIVVLTNIGF